MGLFNINIIMNPIKQYISLIITIIICALICVCTYLYFSKDFIKADNKELTQRITALEAQHEAYIKSIEDATINLQKLREELTDVSRTTREFKQNINSIPKPISEGLNYKEIEYESNKVSNDIFGRIQ